MADNRPLTVTKARSNVGVKARMCGPDHPETVEARRDLIATKTEDYIKRVLAERPPLTAEQRTRLAELLRPVRNGGVA